MQRVLGEELKEGLVLLDQTRTVAIEPGDTRVFVDLKGIKPGWVARDKDHQRVSITVLTDSFVKSKALPVLAIVQIDNEIHSK